MGRTCDLMRFQDYRARTKRKMSKKRAAVYQRRRYWRAKLLRCGVPERDVDSVVDQVLLSRSFQRCNARNPNRRQERRERWKAWYAKNRKRILKYWKDYHLRVKAEDAARKNFIIGAQE